MTEKTEFKLGAMKSPHDTRDFVAEFIFPKARDLDLPETLDLRNDLQMVRNQGSQGTCVAQSLACMKEWQEKQDVGLDEYMSPQFIYNNRSNQDSEGMYGRDAMKIITNIGSCLETTYNYGTIEPRENIKKEAFDEAIKYKAKSYAQVTTIEGLKTALYKNGPCPIFFPVYNYGGEFWKKKNPYDEMLGGHSVTICGYGPDGFLLRNSWGKNWNGSMNGYTIYKYEDFGMHWEIWTTIDDESPMPDPKPEPDNGCCMPLKSFFKKK